MSRFVEKAKGIVISILKIKGFRCEEWVKTYNHSSFQFIGNLFKVNM